MAASKTAATMTASGTLTAGTPITSSVTTLTTYDFATVYAIVTNGATGPTVGATVTIQVSPDNTTFYSYAQPAGTVASTTYWFRFTLDPADQYVKINFAGNTVQNCTVQAQISYGTW